MSYAPTDHPYISDPLLPNFCAVCGQTRLSHKDVQQELAQFSEPDDDLSDDDEADEADEAEEYGEYEDYDEDYDEDYEPVIRCGDCGSTEHSTYAHELRDAERLIGTDEDDDDDESTATDAPIHYQRSPITTACGAWDGPFYLTLRTDRVTCADCLRILADRTGPQQS